MVKNVNDSTEPSNKLVTAENINKNANIYHLNLRFVYLSYYFHQIICINLFIIFFHSFYYLFSTWNENFNNHPSDE